MDEKEEIAKSFTSIMEYCTHHYKKKGSRFRTVNLKCDCPANCDGECALDNDGTLPIEWYNYEWFIDVLKIPVQWGGE